MECLVNLIQLSRKTRKARTKKSPLPLLESTSAAENDSVSFATTEIFYTHRRAK